MYTPEIQTNTPFPKPFATVWCSPGAENVVTNEYDETSQATTVYTTRLDNNTKLPEPKK